MDRSLRGTSTAVSHVLTIGMATVLISLLLLAAGGLLDTERDRSTEASLETVGERLAAELESVDRLATRSDNGHVNLTATHPQSVTSVGYTVELRDPDACADTPLLEGDSPCLELTASAVGVTTHVPFETTTEVDTGTAVSGGPIEIGYVDGQITISEGEP